MRHTVAHIFCLLCLSLGRVSAEAPAEPEGDGEVALPAFFGNRPNSTAGVGVDVITGIYREGGADLVVAGGEAISLSRHYTSSARHDATFHEFWSLGQGDELIDGSPLKEIHSGGSRLFFQGNAIAKEMLSRNFVNTGQGALSGQNNIKNLRLEKHKERWVLSGNCGESIFRKIKHAGTRLQEELRKNGNRIQYGYNGDGILSKIESFSTSGRQLGVILLDHPHDTYKKEGKVAAYASDGRYVLYKFSKHPSLDDRVLTHVSPSYGPPVEYTYEPIYKKKNVKLTRKSLPDGRFLATEYYKKGDNNDVGVPVRVKERKDPRYGRVKLQKAPVGHDSSPQVTSRFVYQIAEEHPYESAGRTDVYNALNGKTSYLWNRGQRLKELHYFVKVGGEDHFTAREVLFWGKDGDIGNLRGRALYTPDVRALAAISYTYDGSGNVIQEIVSGNLTGNGSQLAVDQLGQPKPGCGEQCVKEYSYDGENRITEIRTPYTTLQITYHGGSNHPARKLLISRHDGMIREREFFQYDDAGALVFAIHDDGCTPDVNNLTGISERSLRRIAIRQGLPANLPEWINDSYWDSTSQQEQTCKILHNYYEAQAGNLVRTDTHDSNHQLAYSECWNYDAWGQITEHLNRSGEKTRRVYDRNGNHVLEEGPLPGTWKEMVYDHANRLSHQTTCGHTGERKSESYGYNFLGEKTLRLDNYGNDFLTTYDSMGRIVREETPRVTLANGQTIRMRTELEYDVLGAVSAITDSAGARIQQTNTAYGTPYRIVFPDNSVEERRYRIDGKIEKVIKNDGTSIEYIYDWNGRLEKQLQKDADGKEILTTLWSYNTFHLLRKEDSAGHLSEYRYDGAGRLVETQEDGARTTYSYNPLGYVATMTQWPDGQAPITTHYLYDIYGRVIDEQVESEGVVHRHKEALYDLLGREIQSIRYTEAGAAITKRSYSPLNDTIIDTNALGESTVTIASDLRNELNQLVRVVRVTDPAGLTTCTTADALGRPVKIEKSNPFGVVFARQELRYDAAGRLAQQLNSAIELSGSGEVLSTDEITWEYDSFGRELKMIEKSRGEVHVTTTSYDRRGCKSSVVYPDLITLFYKYDAACRLKEVTSSDATVAYEYEYDAANRLSGLIDRVQDQRTSRSYDRLGRLLSETLGNGLTTSYQYDSLNRLVALEYPDSTSVSYEFSGPVLQRILRRNAAGEELYHQTTTRRDLSGRPLEIELPGGSGTLVQHRDLLGRLTAINHPLWQQEAGDFDAAGNLLKKTTVDAWSGEEPLASEYRYDGLYQLVEERGGFPRSYRFNSLYDRIENNGQAVGYDAFHRLTTDGNKRYEYDGRGNLTAIFDGEQLQLSCHYDSMNRLVGVENAETRTQYIYDALGRRLSKSTESADGLGGWSAPKIEHFAYWLTREIGSYDPEGLAATVRVLGETHLASESAATVAIEIAGKCYAAINDLHGSVGALLAFDGSVAAGYRYSAYGEAVEFLMSGHESVHENPWRWMGKRYDPETSWTFFGLRYYSPEMGRWTTRDPIGYSAGPNLYAYVENRPLLFTDAYGLAIADSDDDRGSRPRYDEPDRDEHSARDSDDKPEPKPRVEATVPKERGWLHFVRKGFECIGNVIERVFHHVIPIRGVKDIGRLIGHIIAGKPLRTFVPSWNAPCSQVITAGNRPGESGDLIIMNGMNTTLEEFQERIQRTSDDNDGQEITGVYNSTGGTVADCFRFLWTKLGGCSKASHLFAQQVYQTYQEGRQILVEAHSLGVALVQQAMKHIDSSIRNKMEVTGFGGAAILAESGCGKVRNYASTSDIIPFIASPIDYILHRWGSKRHSETMEFLPAQGPPLIDHGWDGSTYGPVSQNLHKRERRDNR